MKFTNHRVKFLLQRAKIIKWKTILFMDRYSIYVYDDVDAL